MYVTVALLLILVIMALLLTLRQRAERRRELLDPLFRRVSTWEREGYDVSDLRDEAFPDRWERDS